LATYTCKIRIPDFLDKVIAAPLLLCRWFWYGYTFRRIPLTIGKYARIDPRRYGELSGYRWYAKKNGRGYVALRFAPEDGRAAPVYMHRQILNAQKGQIVDHKNRDSLDNRDENLRFANSSQNSFNRVKMNSKTSSRYTGVSFIKEYGRWRAYIEYSGNRRSLGYFDSEIDAAKAYDTAAKKYHGEFACLNFPENNEKGLRGLLRHRFTQIYTVYKKLIARLELLLKIK
jgi:hypothetical protein